MVSSPLLPPTSFHPAFPSLSLGPALPEDIHKGHTWPVPKTNQRETSSLFSRTTFLKLTLTMVYSKKYVLITSLYTHMSTGIYVTA